MPVTTLATRLPDAATVRRWSQALAALDAILSPEWEYRYFSFDADWGEGESLASMRNGSGDDYSIVFSAHGAWARGFDHESELSPYLKSELAVWDGLVAGVPPELAHNLEEPAFCDLGVLRATVCLWRLAGDDAWRHGDVVLPDGEDADGADWLFAELDGRPETYRQYALEYFEREVDLAAIGHVYRHEPISDAVVAALNPELTLADVADDLYEIGFRAV